MKTNLAHRDFLQAATVNPSQVEWPSWMPRLSFSPPQTNPRGDVMVVIFLRGAADVLNMVAPFGEDGYYESRPTIAVPRPDDSRANQSERAIDLDGFFGLGQLRLMAYSRSPRLGLR